ncbi:hypothetical protein JN00_0338 [Metamycoplasma subdolum]|uniref:Uncharacterized protein n=1 Tax=Metamycoplasma subdolum TaxID=92407 RepID=A0A3M0A6S3_9BACT|nr:hypothetical protein [Metamycoplasma subdolum]RMA78508.1 hypothetical protein JN00_0338 [Metamycoplasma subdolum]WPB50440.1 hypothetical protein R9C05_02435 [Metamycoplasma subdolum]
MINEVEFKIYSEKHKVNKKVISDIISRLKKIEKSLENCDLNDEFQKNCCKSLLNLFAKNGNNNEIKKVLIGSLPIGKYSMSTYRHAIKKYVSFMKINKS